MNRFRRLTFAGTAPLVAFVVVYVATCLVGAALMLAGYRPFIDLFEYFSGTTVARLDGGNMVKAIILVIVAPLVLAVGYVAALAIPVPARARAALGHRIARTPPTPRWLPPTAFSICAAWAWIEIIQAGAVGDIGSWLEYAEWVAARQRNFASIGFLSYVNIYLFVPLGAAWVLVSELGHAPTSRSSLGRIGGWALRWLPALVAVAASLLLFQKKAAVVSLVIVGVARVVYRPPRLSRNRRPLLLLGPTLIVALYFATVVVPLVGDAPSRANVPAVALYALFAPLTRTSSAALYYPVVYPDQHPYYGLDLLQDVVGFGSSPDDNIVVWHAMNPYLAGTSAAPFQFNLYSQAGILGALGGSLLAGILLALMWRLARAEPWPREWRSLLVSLVILTAIYLAIDSARNGVVVSYGVAWGFLFVALALGFTRMIRPDASTPTIAGLSRTGFLIGSAFLVGCLVGVVASPGSSTTSASRAVSQRPSVTRIAPTPTDVRFWRFDNGLPAGWRALPAVGVSPAGDYARVFSNNRPRSPQISSRPFVVPAGRYEISTDVRAIRGGVRVAAVDAARNRTLGASSQSRTWGRSVLTTRFTTSRATPVKVMMSGVRAAARQNVWELYAVSVRPAKP